MVFNHLIARYFICPYSVLFRVFREQNRFCILSRVSRAGFFAGAFVFAETGYILLQQFDAFFALFAVFFAGIVWVAGAGALAEVPIGEDAVVEVGVFQIGEQVLRGAAGEDLVFVISPEESIESLGVAGAGLFQREADL